MTSHSAFAEDESDLPVMSHEESARLFLAKKDKPQLEARRLFANTAKDGDAMTLKTHMELRSQLDIKELRNADDPLQIFTVRQERSWTTLDISHELFTEFTAAYDVFPSFWNCVKTFGTKYDEHECEFPGFQSQWIPQLGKRAFECAYVLRRAELNHRTLSEGQSPWSIRQTAVYHRLKRSTKTQSRFLLISPSKSVERKLEDILEYVTRSQSEALRPSVIHSILVADSIKGWMGYIAWLEQDLKERSDRITLSKLGARVKDFTFSVNDRQALKLTEDAVIDLQTIASTMLNTVEGVRRYCGKCCKVCCDQNPQIRCICTVVSERLQDHVSAVELIISRAQSLRDRVVSSAQLLSDLLRYEDQRALKELTEQSADESKAMLSLAEKSTKDAEATKVLTIIGLVYLPTTFVANFFSTEFVKADDNGVVKVATNTWLLAVLALPLTLLTIGIWWMCVRYKTGTYVLLQPVREKLKRYRGLVTRAHQTHDVENPQVPQPGLVQNSTRTWSSNATTLGKEGR